uniref:Peptidase M16 N-terminal domain-containing protein n=1 Tax=Ditylum brightwellii TaxID=49249 RepID=A0A6U3RP04_9STRA|mmetsp:Transcript_30004/g.44623  ORF Transcript_30004/g.44623 Transcript_30004/m.44623 type:complete len:1011 (+) Transcript_30004:119-3151(+)
MMRTAETDSVSGVEDVAAMMDKVDLNESVATEVETSPQDERHYHSYKLSNSLHCLLISDKTTDKASAAMDVRVGHLCDPDDVKGLAHFCEHMLFMGTEKYPDENDYNVYLNANGGSSNAYTDMESTNYYFDVNADKLEGALDRFAQFFISPLFNESSTSREMQAVDSEHCKNLQSDFWRLFQLYKSLAKSSHPFSKFGSGNIQTLKDEPVAKGVDIRSELLTFYKTYYSANIMKLVVLGKQSIDELKQMVDMYFKGIPNQNLSVPHFPGEPYGKAELAKRLSVMPVSEVRTLEMHFPIREIETLYQSKPTRYISHLVGHEGFGSILQLLKDLGYANELSAGEMRSCSDWSSFGISIDLTDEGLESVEDVVVIVFAYLNMLKRSGPQRWIHDETSTVASCSFRFLSKRSPINYTCALASNMQLYPPCHILSGPYKIYQYNPQAIVECLECLTPQNMLLTVMSKKFEGETKNKEPWYSTEYTMEDIGDDLIKRCEEASVEDKFIANRLHFPEQNDMIATDFTLKSVPNFPKDEPRLLLDNSSARLWYKPDNVFDMPKLNVICLLQTPFTNESPKSFVSSFLWVSILQEQCTSFTYLASMASLHCSFVSSKNGIEVSVSGYNHKVEILMQRIVNAMIDLPTKLTNEVFERIKDKVSKQYQNISFLQPYQHAIYGADICLEDMKWSISEKKQALKDISMEDIIYFSKCLMKQFFLEMLIHGNVSPDEAKKISSTILEMLKPSTLHPSSKSSCSTRVIRLNSGNDYIHSFEEFNKENTNSCILNIYQIKPIPHSDLIDNATLSLLHHLIKEPFFDELRTKDQLGYLVHTSIKTNGDNVKSLLCLIQSDAYDPIYMDERIEAFLEGFRNRLVDMGKEEFQDNVEAVVASLLEKNKNIGEESSKYWSVINNKSYIFEKYQTIASHVSNLTPQAVLRFFDKYIARSEESHRKKLSVQVFATKFVEKMNEQEEKMSQVTNGDGEMKIIPEGDVVEFKRTMSLYPLPPEVNVEGMRIEIE